ncbi:HOG (high osmolarity glycerol) pathway protein, partial [Teratosphaeriaceae sp. CCFEE 6253]
MSTLSHTSRPASTATLASPPPQQEAHTTLIRDFAWSPFHPLHYGAPDAGSSTTASGQSTPASEYARRLSVPGETSSSSTTGAGGGWTAGPWGGDGVMYGDPEGTDEALPSTSFGGSGGDDGDDTSAAGAGEEGGSSSSTMSAARRTSQRKSRSYATMTDYERGRRRESAGFRRGRASGEMAGAGVGAGGGDMFMFTGGLLQSDPAGRESLRQSRG